MVLAAGLGQNEGRPTITVRKPAEAAPGSNIGDGRLTRASELLETEVVYENGDSLGTIVDLVIDNRSGQVNHVVVDDGEKFRPIPWRTLAMYEGEEPSDRYFIIGTDRDRFVQAPAITREEWTTITTPQWQTYVPEVTRFYSDVRAVTPSDVRKAERKLEQGIRKAERKLR
jgi:sporulation protein YlmC with PRC-barrel domain